MSGWNHISTFYTYYVVRSFYPLNHQFAQQRGKYNAGTYYRVALLGHHISAYIFSHIYVVENDKRIIMMTYNNCVVKNVTVLLYFFEYVILY